MVRFAVALVLWYLALSVTPQPQPMPSGLGASIGHQRGDVAADAMLEALQPSVWMDWVYNPLRMSDDRYLPMAYSMRLANAQQYIDAAADMPGRFWLLGSEPNLAVTHIDPAEAAQFAQRWQAEVDGDWACCGTVQWAGWQQWMDAYLANDGPIPAAWQIHIFDRFAYPPVAEFRAWMQAHDVVRPILVTETACPWCDVAVNMALMDGMAQLVADGTVQAAVWYSADPYGDYHGLWPDTGLFANGGELTALGAHWLSLQPSGANWPGATPLAQPAVADVATGNEGN